MPTISNNRELAEGNYFRIKGESPLYVIGGWKTDRRGRNKGINLFSPEDKAANIAGPNEVDPTPTTLEKLDPIRLSKEILIKCGFSEDPEGNSVYSKIEDRKSPDHDFYIFPSAISGTFHMSTKLGNEAFGRHFRFLHELQNIYFALTGNEIRYNP